MLRGPYYPSIGNYRIFNLRVIKNNTLAYEAFHKSLPSITRGGDSKSSLRLVVPGEDKQEQRNPVVKDFNYLQEIFKLEKNIRDASDLAEIRKHFIYYLSGIIRLEESEIFLTEENGTALIPLIEHAGKNSVKAVKRAQREGIIDWVFETGKPKIIPDMDAYNDHGAKRNYILVPVFQEKKRLGVLSILTSFQFFSEDSLESQLIQLGLSVVMWKIELLNKKQELLSVYKDMQVYQSKLANDYKLSAIGELTTGIVEDILSPLQVISAYAGMLQEEGGEADDEMIEIVNTQIKKVKTIISRLVKFASLNGTDPQIQPCNLNDIVREFNEVVSTSLQNQNYECLLDLEEDIPFVLTQPNYINQILTNVFSLIRSKHDAGGIFIQTKFIKQNITLRIVTTDYIEELDGSRESFKEDLNIRIIGNLMRKHEGSVKFESGMESGTTVILSFPLKRKISR